MHIVITKVKNWCLLNTLNSHPFFFQFFFLEYFFSKKSMTRRPMSWQNHTPTHTFPVSTEMFFSHGHYLPQYLNIDDLQLSFSKEFRLSSVLMTFVSFCLFFSFSLLHINCWAEAGLWTWIKEKNVCGRSFWRNFATLWDRQ